MDGVNRERFGTSIRGRSDRTQGLVKGTRGKISQSDAEVAGVNASAKAAVSEGTEESASSLVT